MRALPAWFDSERWALDRRSLGLCRMATGLVVLGDLLTRAQTFRLHYTDLGILPRQALFELRILHFPSVHALSGWEPYLVALWLLHGAAALALAVGYRTRASGLLTWYLTLSLQERMFMANNGGDKLLASLLFWGLFLPWGDALSVDAAGRTPGQAPPPKVAHLVTAIVVLQPIMMYWVSVLHKIEPTWLRGEVLLFALQSDFYAYPWALGLLTFPAWVWKGLTYATLSWEALGPLALLSARPRIRGGAIVAFLAMHAGFGLFLRIGIFTWTPMLYMLALLPSAFWSWSWAERGARDVERLARRLASRLEVQAGGEHSASAPSFALQLGLGCLFLYVTAFSLSHDHRLARYTPQSAGWLASLTGLQQRWTVFVNVPEIFDGWLVVQASLADGREVDLFQGNDPLRWEKPASPYPLYDSFRWPTPLVIVTSEPRFHPWFVRALALAWENRHPGDRVTGVRLVLFREWPRRQIGEFSVEKMVLWEGPPP